MLDFPAYWQSQALQISWPDIWHDHCFQAEKLDHLWSGLEIGPSNDKMRAVSLFFEMPQTLLLLSETN